MHCRWLDEGAGALASQGPCPPGTSAEGQESGTELAPADSAVADAYAPGHNPAKTAISLYKDAPAGMRPAERSTCAHGRPPGRWSATMEVLGAQTAHQWEDIKHDLLLLRERSGSAPRGDVLSHPIEPESRLQRSKVAVKTSPSCVAGVRSYLWTSSTRSPIGTGYCRPDRTRLRRDLSPRAKRQT